MQEIHIYAEQGNVPALAQEIENGVDINCRDEFFKATPLMYAIQSDYLGLPGDRQEIIEWLIAEGCDIEATDGLFNNTALIMASEYGNVNAVRTLLAAGANIQRVDDCGETAITKAIDVEIVRMLIDAGGDLNEVSNEMRRLITGFSDSKLQISRTEYLAGKERRFGKTNPELMSVEFWKAMINSGVNAWTARDTFEDEDYTTPVWCFDRFGRTITELPDGRIVEIAGEHEDYYDVDFCIYNDVVVHQGNGTYQIFGYPQDVFPPTDFHTATLVGEYIYIIGSLGYNNKRICNETQVYRLHCETFKIEKVETRGDKPGWIYKHKAYYKEPAEIHIFGGQVYMMVEQKAEYVDNLLEYSLDLTNLTWKLL